MATINDDKSLRGHLLLTARQLDELIERKNKLNEKLIKDIDAKIDLISKRIGHQIYTLNNECPIEGEFNDSDRNLVVKWKFTTFIRSGIVNDKYVTDYPSCLTFMTDGENDHDHFRASYRSDMYDLQTDCSLYDEDEDERERIVKTYHEYLNKWIRKYIFYGELTLLMEEIHINSLAILDE